MKPKTLTVIVIHTVPCDLAVKDRRAALKPTIDTPTHVGRPICDREAVHYRVERFAGVKVGDSYVFDPFLNPEKSTAAFCPRGLLPVLIQLNSIWEMMAEWADSGKEEMAEITFRNVRCLDPGLEDGGVGGVIFRFRAEKLTM